MKLPSDRISDEAYVERLRDRMTQSRKVGLYLSVFYTICFLILCVLIQRMIDLFRDVSQHSLGFDPGFKIGVLGGITIGFVVFQAAKHLIDAIMMTSGVHFSRMPRLLVRYYDIAAQKNPR